MAMNKCKGLIQIVDTTGYMAQGDHLNFNIQSHFMLFVATTSIDFGATTFVGICSDKLKKFRQLKSQL